MEAHTRKPRGILAIPVTIALVMACVGMRHVKPPYGATRPRSEFTEQQIEAKAERVCGLLSEDERQLHQTTDMTMLFMPDGRSHRLYLIDCEADAGKHLVHSTWDAETGRLVSAVHTGRRRQTQVGKLGGRINPAQVAWHWMERLDVANLSPYWQVPSPPVLGRFDWTVVMRCEHYCATVMFDPHTEDLISISVQTTGQSTHTR